MSLFKNFGKREGLVYIIVFLWVTIGGLSVYEQTSLSDLAIYFASLTAYSATYIWAEAKRPSEKVTIFKKGPNSRREVMIYFIVLIWTIAGIGAIYFKSSLLDLSIYFISLTGFVAPWIAGEVYNPDKSE
jgi:hypothetical protein